MGTTGTTGLKQSIDLKLPTLDTCGTRQTRDTLFIMLIGFDASRAFGVERTGTENYSYYLFRALAVVDRKNKYRVYVRVPWASKVSGVSKAIKKALGTSGTRGTLDTLQNWPSNFEFVQIKPNRLWTQLGLAIETWRCPVDVLFVPAHTLPVLRRRGFEQFKILNLKFKIPYFFAKQTKYVATIHDLGVEYLPNYHKFPQNLYLDFASKYAAGHADALIAVSKATGHDLEKRYGVSAKKVFVVQEGVDSAFFRPRGREEIQKVKLKYQIGGDYILYVGTVQPRKNLQMLIEAFGGAIRLSRHQVIRNIKPGNQKTRIPDNLQLIIAGKLGWDYQAILDAPKKYGVENRVRFLGYVPREDLPALYSGSSLFAFPSLFEGFGLPILEALSCGARVIASDIEPHREILRKISQNLKFKIKNLKFDGVDVPMVLAKVDDEDEWAEFLYQSITKYENRLIKLTQFKQIEAKFSWLEAARQTIGVFEEVLAKE